MAFSEKDLSVIAYANGFTLWHYTTADSSVEDEGYFNPASNILHVGDIIISNIDNNNSAGLLLVTESSVREVVVSDMTLIKGEKNG